MQKASAQALKEQNQPGDLHAAAGGAGAGADDHEAQQNGFRKTGPLVKVRRGKACGCGDTGNLEGCVAEGFLQGGVLPPDVPGDEQCAAQDDAEVGPQLLIPEYGSKLPEQQKIVAGEIDAEQKHEYGRHILQIGAIAGEGIVAHAEAAGSCGAKGVAHRFEDIHLAQHQEYNVRNGQADIENVENGSGLPHFGNQLAHAGAGAFRPEQVHSEALASVCAGDNGQQEHQNAHAAHPVAEAAPVHDALGQAFHLRKNGSAGGGKAGDDFKKRIDKFGDCTGEHEGQASGQGEDDPAQGHADHAVRRIEVALCAPAQEPQQAGNDQQQHHGDQKRLHRGVLATVQADEHGGDHKESFQQQDLGDETPRHFVVHSRCLTRRCRSAAAEPRRCW